MPTRFIALPAHALILVEGRGEVSFEELARLQDDVSAHPAFTPEVRVLIDGRGGNPRQLSGGMIRTLVERSRIGARRRAVVVDEGFAYGVGRIFAAFAELRGHATAVFTTREEACAWLGVDPAALPAAWSAASGPSDAGVEGR